MRIIRGKFRGRQITPPKQFNARPTTDFAKEALFNILENTYEFEELQILDLFSGTGGISYEFLSRGVKSVTAVEISKKQTEFIQTTAESMFPKQLHAVAADAFSFVKKRPLKYDIIFADPPYTLAGVSDLPELIFQNENLNSQLTLIIEHSEIIDFSKHLYFKQVRNYGKVHFSFFEKG